MTRDWQKALERLQPLEAEIAAALAAGDVGSAMHLVFHGAADAASLVCEAPIMPGGARAHSIYVELRPQGLAVYEDGTLEEGGSYVNLAYHCEEIAFGQADILASEWKSATLSVPYWAVDSS